MNNVRPFALFGAFALVVGFAACGDDDDSDTTERDEASEDAGDSNGAGDEAAPEDDGAATEASAEFVTPADGDEVTSPVEVEMAAEGIDIVEAGAPAEGEGHFHVMVDTGCHFEVGDIIPDDDAHLHFGDASTTAEVELEPGEHTLCLQVGDGTHAVLDANQEITVTVTE
jgi:hypothetical protein